MGNQQETNCIIYIYIYIIGFSETTRRDIYLHESIFYKVNIRYSPIFYESKSILEIIILIYKNIIKIFLI